MHPGPNSQNIDPGIFSQLQNYPLFPGQDGTINHQGERLELHAKDRWSIAASTIVEAIQATDLLVQEIMELKAQIQRLKAGEGCLQYAHFYFPCFLKLRLGAAFQLSCPSNGILEFHCTQKLHFLRAFNAVTFCCRLLNSLCWRHSCTSQPLPAINSLAYARHEVGPSYRFHT